MSETAATPPSLVGTGHVGAAGEAAVAARLLAQGYTIAQPVPDLGVDFVVLSRDTLRAVPVQVKTSRAPSLGFKRAWFRPSSMVLVIAWLLPGGERFFVFDGVADVERFLGGSASTDSWLRRGVWTITLLSDAQLPRLDPFEGAWQVFRRRLEPLAPPPPRQSGEMRLTRHVREQIDAGEVRSEWIAATLHEPERRSPDPRWVGVTLSWRRVPEFGNRTLRVAHRSDGGAIVVITAFFDRGESS